MCPGPHGEDASVQQALILLCKHGLQPCKGVHARPQGTTWPSLGAQHSPLHSPPASPGPLPALLLCRPAVLDLSPHQTSVFPLMKRIHTTFRCVRKIPSSTELLTVDRSIWWNELSQSSYNKCGWMVAGGCALTLLRLGSSRAQTHSRSASFFLGTRGAHWGAGPSPTTVFSSPNRGRTLLGRCGCFPKKTCVTGLKLCR